MPGQSAKSDRKATCFPVTLSQPISTIYYLAFVYRGMACHAAGCRFHPYSVKHSFLDYFWAEISSLFAGFFSQGWFPAIEFILICWFLLAGMIPSHRISSLFAGFFSQGWFPPRNFISICRFLLTGMISSRGFHPDLLVSSHRDDSRPGISSLFAGFSSQGWFPAIDFILIYRFLLPGMISSHRFHPDLQVSPPRDDFQP